MFYFANLRPLPSDQGLYIFVQLLQKKPDSLALGSLGLMQRQVLCHLTVLGLMVPQDLTQSSD